MRRGISLEMSSEECRSLLSIKNSVGISGSLVHLDVCRKVAWDDSHPGGSISVVLPPLWRTSARVNRQVGFARQWDEASARLWSHVEFGRCIRLIELQVSALSVSRYEIWGPSEGHAVKRHDLASFASHLSYLPVLEMTNSSAAMLSPLRASSLRNGRKHPAQAAVLSLKASCLSRASASKGDGADFLFFFSFFLVECRLLPRIGQRLRLSSTERKGFGSPPVWILYS